MAREPDTTTIAWYAYQDSNQREYYHEPISGETSWVMPSSLLRCSTNNDAMMGVGGKTVNNDNDNVQGVHKNFSTTGKSSRLRQFCVVGGAVIFILLFNTLFLLVVIRVIADDDGIIKINHLFRGQALPLPPSSQVGNGSHQHYVNDRIIGDAMVAASSTDNPFILTAPDDGMQQRDNSVISNYSTTHDDTHVLGGKDSTVESTQNVYIKNNDTIHPPMNCWIPFSYIIVGKCRRHAREGLPMPLADASSLPLI